MEEPKIKEKVEVIGPQPGFQTEFLSTPADIAIGGGSAGGGKTFSILLEALRNMHVPGFGAIFFRRTYPQIKNEGGLWDASRKIYPRVGLKSNESTLAWSLKNGNKIKFSHLQHEKNALDYQGTEIPLIVFDELTHFTETQFFYLLSRNRSTSGVRPYVRATCNPDPDSWVKRLIQWYINPETGLPISERSGKLRYFTRDDGNLVWGDSREEVIAKCPHIFGAKELESYDISDLVKSFTFIPGSVYNNLELLKKDPGYLGNLLSLDEAEKDQLLHGNWNVRADGNSLIDHNAINDSFFAEGVLKGQRFITADVAMEGSDLFIVGYWNGWRLEDVEILEKSNGKEVEDTIKKMAAKYIVPRSHIVFDADGVGNFLGGYLQGAVAFHNGATPIKETKSNLTPNYANLATQCAYVTAERFNNHKVFINKGVAEKRIKNKFAKDYLAEELKAVKKLKKDADGKLRVIPKDQIKNALGRSPDFWDMIKMRAYFDLRPVATSGGVRASFKSKR